MAATKINWTKAFQYYCSDTTISYEKVAEHFGVSLTQVKEHGTNEDWVQLRADAMQKANQLAVNKAADEMVKRNELHANIGRLMTKAAVDQMQHPENPVKPTSPRDVREWAQTGIELERKAYGMDAKENVTVNITYQKPEWFLNPTPDVQQAEIVVSHE